MCNAISIKRWASNLCDLIKYQYNFGLNIATSNNDTKYEDKLVNIVICKNWLANKNGNQTIFCIHKKKIEKVKQRPRNEWNDKKRNQQSQIQKKIFHSHQIRFCFFSMQKSDGNPKEWEKICERANIEEWREKNVHWRELLSDRRCADHDFGVSFIIPPRNKATHTHTQILYPINEMSSLIHENHNVYRFRIIHHVIHHHVWWIFTLSPI